VCNYRGLSHIIYGVFQKKPHIVLLINFEPFAIKRSFCTKMFGKDYQLMQNLCK